MRLRYPPGPGKRAKKNPATEGGVFSFILGTNRLERLDVLGRRALRTLRHVELHLLTLCQSLEAGALNGRMMNEDILATIFGRDESEALAIVEPLDSSSYHGKYLSQH
jgi:hypothetical protein